DRRRRGHADPPGQAARAGRRILTDHSVPPVRTRAIAVALFSLSGGSRLAYHVVWVRQFGRVFGNTLHSAALVTAVFVGGLGVGALVAGRWADRRHARGGS